MYDFLSNYTLTRDIGTEFQYSNLGAGLLGHALSLKAGKVYEELTIERICDPFKFERYKDNARKGTKRPNGHAA